MKRLAALSTLLLACQSGPRDSIGWEERWEVLVLTEYGNILDTRMVVGNRELLRGQGRVHMDHWSAVSMSVNHTRELAPGDVSIDPHGGGIQLGLDRLFQEDIWKLQIGSTDANLMLELTPESPTPSPHSWQPSGGQWSMAAPVSGANVLGWLEAGGRGGRFRGRGVVLHRGGDGSPSLPREAVFVMAKNIWIGLDQQDGVSLAWAHVDGQALSVDDLSFERTGEGATLDLRPAADLVIQIKAEDPVGTQDPLAHYSWLERTAASLFSDVAWRRIEAGQATLTRGEETRSAGAILLSEGPAFEPLGSTGDAE
jgi:hypothetical protein